MFRNKVMVIWYFCLLLRFYGQILKFRD